MKIKIVLLVLSCFSAVFAMNDDQAVQGKKTYGKLIQSSSLAGRVILNTETLDCRVTRNPKSVTSDDDYTHNDGYTYEGTYQKEGRAIHLKPKTAQLVYNALASYARFK